MEELSEFIIPFVGLKDGQHRFNHQLEKTFFDAFTEEGPLGASISCSVLLDKKSSMLQVEIDFSGTMIFPCDRCNENCEVPVNGERTLYYKFSEGEDEEDEDVFFIGNNEREIDISRPIYEYVVLSIPARRVHDENDCDPAVLDALEGSDEGDDEGTDPRWDALKKLK